MTNQRAEADDGVQAAPLPERDQRHERLEGIIGRKLSETELSAAESMESEHASYKSTKVWLRELPTDGPNHYAGIGSEAASVAIGVVGGVPMAVSYSSESHNGPSYVCAHPGAATGVGGNERDQAAKDAQKVFALLEARRQCDWRRNPHGDPIGQHFEETTAGIQDYGNATGVPHMGGSIRFHPTISGNNLVNVMALSVSPRSRLRSNQVPNLDEPEKYVGIYVGKASDLTGIGGTKFASQAIDMSNFDLNEKAVQDPDPHLQHEVIRGLEILVDRAIEQGWDDHLSIKDMGAAGLLCSTLEQLHNGIGTTIHGELIPQNEPRTSIELLEAETQERFFIYVHEDHAESVLHVFNEEVGLPSINVGARAAVVGRCTSDGMYRFINNGVLDVELPAEALTEVPGVRKPIKKPQLAVSEIPEIHPLKGTEAILEGTSFKSDHPVFSHYDNHIGRSNILRRGEAAAPLRTHKKLGNRIGLSAVFDSNIPLGVVDPALQAQDSFVRAAYRMALVGASPIGVSNNANFGRTDVPEELWAFVEAQRGIAEICTAWELEPSYLEEITQDPLIAEKLEADERRHVTVNSGNCSMNKANANTGTAIPATTILGTVGWTNQPDRYTRLAMDEAGATLYVVGRRDDNLGATELLTEVMGPDFINDHTYRMDPDRMQQEVGAIRDAVRQGYVKTGNVIAEGGLVAAVGEMLASSPTVYGARLAPPPDEVSATGWLFSERPGVVAAVSPENEDAFVQHMRERGIEAYVGGVVTADASLDIQSPDATFSYRREYIDEMYHGKLEQPLEVER